MGIPWYIPWFCRCCEGMFLIFSFFTDIVSDIIYSENNGFVQLTVMAEGDNIRYDWTVNSQPQTSSIGGILKIPPLPLGVNRIMVNASNTIGFDSKSMLIQIENGAPSDATSAQPGTNEKG